MNNAHRWALTHILHCSARILSVSGLERAHSEQQDLRQERRPGSYRIKNADSYICSQLICRADGLATYAYADMLMHMIICMRGVAVSAVQDVPLELLLSPSCPTAASSWLQLTPASGHWPRTPSVALRTQARHKLCWSVLSLVCRCGDSDAYSCIHQGRVLLIGT